MARRMSIADPSALEEAQELIYDAWDAPTARRRIELAKKALTLSPLCADAYVLLAEHSRRGSTEAMELWRRSVAAGAEALGKAAFEDMAGEFWGFLETRPYMRARLGLAHALWGNGERDDAIDHLRSMLELNPNDNQGARYTLVAWLLKAERDTDLAALLAEYPKDYSAVWSWTVALLAFRKGGDGAIARREYTKALSVNAHVPAYLHADRPMPSRLPPFLSPGEPDEAVHYVFEHRPAWERTPGALDWLRSRETVKQVRKKPRRAPPGA